jgi:hypothetical protein
MEGNGRAGLVRDHWSLGGHILLRWWNFWRFLDRKVIGAHLAPFAQH